MPNRPFILTIHYRKLLATDFNKACILGLLLCLSLALVNSVYAQPIAPTPDPNYLTIRKILQTPEDRIDLAATQIAIDQMIDPQLNAAATLAQIDSMARRLKALIPAGASSRLTLDALRYHIYQPSPWNDQRPFSYNLDDPYGADIQTKLLATYLATRKGNCISMPMLFIILGQKLGIDVTAAQAPNHVFVKYRDTDGKVYNLETTSGAGFTRDVWMRQESPMTDESIASGIYMRPLTKKETAVVMVDTLLEFYTDHGMTEQGIQMASLALEYNPRDVVAMLLMRENYLKIWRRDYTSQYPNLAAIPTTKLPRYIELDGYIKSLERQAFALGWRPTNPKEDVEYQQSINRQKSAQ